MPTIRIDSEVYSWLQKQARPFEDSPNSVLRRIAELENTSEKIVVLGQRRQTSQRDNSKKTPQSEFRKPILMILKKHGGEAHRMKVLNELERVMSSRLTEYDKTDIASGSIRWQKSAEWEIRSMRERGLLKPVHQTARGMWSLTEKGHKAL